MDVLKTSQGVEITLSHGEAIGLLHLASCSYTHEGCQLLSEAQQVAKELQNKLTRNWIPASSMPEEYTH